MKEHEETRSMLSSYLDNCLNPEEKEAVRVHLGRCGSCRGLLADLEWATEQIKRLPRVDPPPWLMPQIMTKVSQTDASLIPDRFRVPFRVKLLLALSLLILVGLAIGYHDWVGRKNRETLPRSTVPQAKVRQPAPAALPPAAGVGRSPRVMPTRAASPAPPKPYQHLPGIPVVPPPSVASPKAEPVAVPDEPVREVPELQPAEEWVIPDRDAADSK